MIRSATMSFIASKSHVCKEMRAFSRDSKSSQTELPQHNYSSSVNLLRSRDPGVGLTAFMAGPGPSAATTSVSLGGGASFSSSKVSRASSNSSGSCVPSELTLVTAAGLSEVAARVGSFA